MDFFKIYVILKAELEEEKERKIDRYIDTQIDRQIEVERGLPTAGSLNKWPYWPELSWSEGRSQELLPVSALVQGHKDMWHSN